MFETKCFFYCGHNSDIYHEYATLQDKDQRFISVINYTPQSPGEVSLREGDTVKVLDNRDMEKWLVSIDSTGEVGWAPSVFLESPQLLTSVSGKDDALARRT